MTEEEVAALPHFPTSRPRCGLSIRKDDEKTFSSWKPGDISRLPFLKIDNDTSVFCKPRERAKSKGVRGVEMVFLAALLNFGCRRHLHREDYDFGCGIASSFFFFRDEALLTRLPTILPLDHLRHPKLSTDA